MAMRGWGGQQTTILAELKAPDLPTYAEAAKRAGWHHSDERDGVIELPLPYYGQVLERHVFGGPAIPSTPMTDATAGSPTLPHTLL